MKWKRKGGFATASEVGVTYKVKDDGEYHIRLASGEWLHGRCGGAAEAKHFCEDHAAEISLQVIQDGLALEARRQEATKLGGVSKKEKSWAGGIAELIVMIVENPHLAEAMMMRLSEGFNKDLIRGIAFDEQVVKDLRKLSHVEAVRHLRGLLIKTLAECVEEGK
jgi:hypothetical protein